MAMVSHKPVQRRANRPRRFSVEFEERQVLGAIGEQARSRDSLSDDLTVDGTVLEAICGTEAAHTAGVRSGRHRIERSLNPGRTAAK
jgi:hypothetical protein